jgi:hypothetical protein
VQGSPRARMSEIRRHWKARHQLQRASRKTLKSAVPAAGTDLRQLANDGYVDQEMPELRRELSPTKIVNLREIPYIPIDVRLL